MSSEDSLALWREYRRTNDRALRDRLVLTFAPLVKYIVYKKLREMPARCEAEDFIACGLEALTASSGEEAVAVVEVERAPRAPVVLDPVDLRAMQRMVPIVRQPISPMYRAGARRLRRQDKPGRTPSSRVIVSRRSRSASTVTRTSGTLSSRRTVTRSRTRI